MNHLETLIRQYYEWKGYIVRSNVKVGRLGHGGWAGELDIVAYHAQTRHLLHVEPSIDANSWDERERRFAKKFEVGKKHIRKDVFPWVGAEVPLNQVAVLISASRNTLAGAKARSIDDLMGEIRSEVAKAGIMAKNAIPEQYDLLRTIQMAMNGYYRVARPGS